jgi:ribosome-binding protein aMBF1 (putative translation factor)
MGNYQKIGNLTAEIARSKAMAKVRGPFMRVCSACGKYYQPDKKEEHSKICHPRIVYSPRNKPTLREIQKRLDRQAIQRKQNSFELKVAQNIRKKLAKAKAQSLIDRLIAKSKP